VITVSSVHAWIALQRQSPLSLFICYIRPNGRRQNVV
jgi:hypothetical protein